MADMAGNPKREWVRAGAIYALFLALAAVRHYLNGSGLFFQVIWDPVGVYSFFSSDHFALESIKDGFWPLWDHTRGLGAPHVIPTGGNIDYPLRLPVYLLDSRAGWELYILLRFWLAGLFCFLCARELPLKFTGALVAGLAFMLCGYFRQFHNLPDVNVVLLLPLLLFLSMRLARTRKIIYLLILYFVVPQFDNSPESTFYATVFGSSFFLFIGALEYRKQGRSPLGWVILYISIMWVGTIQNGEALYPFVEYWKHSWHFHPETLGGLHVPLSAAVAFVTPAFDFWMAAAPNLSLDHLDQLTIIPGYVGLVTAALVAVGLCRVRRLPAGLIFITVMGVVLAGIIFGVPPFVWLTRLPLVRYFQNFRYAQPFLAFAVALLAGAGLDALAEKNGRRLLAAVAVALTGWVGWHTWVFRHQLLHSPLIGQAAVIAAAGAIIIGLAALAARKWRPGLITLPRALVVALGLELGLYFALAGPVFGPMAYQLEKTPAVDFLNAQSGKPWRIYATDQRILHPNLAGVYGLSDLRDQTPLYLDDYANLFATVNGLTTPEQVMNHFLKGGRFFFELDLSRAPENLLDLLNVRYVLSREPPDINRYWDLDRDPQWSMLTARPEFFKFIPEGNLGGVSRNMLLLHAPARMDFFDEQIRIETEAGLMDHARGCPGADGVFLTAFSPKINEPENQKPPFQVPFNSPPNEGGLIFARFIPPEDSGNWFPFAGGTQFGQQGKTTFSLSSLPGPCNDNRCDFAVLSKPKFVARNVENKEVRVDLDFAQVYDREYRVYENKDVGQRVFAVRELRPPIDIRGLINELSTLSPDTAAFADSAPIPLSPAEITAIVEETGRVSFRSRADGPAFAVISNLYFPGWRAFIDGHEVPVHRTDAILQGVALPMGDSRVELIYDPMSYRPGFWSHLVNWIILFGFFGREVWVSRRRRLLIKSS